MSSSDQRSSINDDLRQVRSEIEELQTLTRMLADEPAEVRDIWHWKWRDVMERVEVLCQQRRDGLFSQEQQEEFVVVSRLLANGRTLIEQLGCRIPMEISHDVYASE